MLPLSEHTLDYLSPDFYHFSEDSIHLARMVSDEISSLTGQLHILDLCAGQGVVGLEIIQAHPQKNIFLDFCELLEEFRPYLEKNRKHFLTEDKLFKSRILIQPLSSLLVPDFQDQWDVVVANPPYYHPDHFSLSPKSVLKNHCRFFIRDSFEIFYETLAYILRPKGKAFFTLLKDGAPNHQKVLNKIRENFIKDHGEKVKIEQKGEGGGALIFVMTSLE